MRIYLEGREIDAPEGISVMELLTSTGTEVPPAMMLRHEYKREVPSMSYGEPPRYVTDFVEEKRLMQREFATRILREDDQVEPFYWEDGGD